MGERDCLRSYRAGRVDGREIEWVGEWKHRVSLGTENDPTIEKTLKGTTESRWIEYSRYLTKSKRRLSRRTSKQPYQ